MSEAEGFMAIGSGVLVTLVDDERIAGKIIGFSEDGIYIHVTVRQERRGMVEPSKELLGLCVNEAAGLSRVGLVLSHVLRGDLYGARLSRELQVLSEGRYRAYLETVKSADDMVLLNCHGVRTHVDSGMVKMIELWEDINSARVLSGLDFEAELESEDVDNV